MDQTKLARRIVKMGIEEAFVETQGQRKATEE